MTTAFLLILNHWFADFFCQSDKMAVNKSKSNKWLTIHALAYIAAMLPFQLYMDYQANGGWVMFGNPAALWWMASNFLLHWITDYYTSRITSYLWVQSVHEPNGRFMGGSWRHWFFTVIGIDQVIHYGCLFYTYQHFMPHV